MNNKFKNVLTFGGFIIFSLIIVYAVSTNSGVTINQDGGVNQSEIIEKSEIQEENQIEEKIVVYILGAIQNSGVVEAPLNSRLYEIIEMAGGETAEADLSLLNLASIVYDGQKIIIPYKDEKTSYKEQVNSAFNNVVINEENNNSNGLININTASVEVLKTLAGIGESTAQKIISYRKENGKFNSIEEIKNVSGIGDSKYNAIKDNITV